MPSHLSFLFLRFSSLCLFCISLGEFLIWLFSSLISHQLHPTLISYIGFVMSTITFLISIIFLWLSFVLVFLLILFSLSHYYLLGFFWILSWLFQCSASCAVLSSWMSFMEVILFEWLVDLATTLISLLRNSKCKRSFRNNFQTPSFPSLAFAAAWQCLFIESVRKEGYLYELDAVS